jgi:hypothetical protein
MKKINQTVQYATKQRKISEMHTAMDVSVKNLESRVLKRVVGRRMNLVERQLALIAAERKKGLILMKVIALLANYSGRNNFDLTEQMSKNLKMMCDDSLGFKSRKVYWLDCLVKYVKPMKKLKLTMMTIQSLLKLGGFAESIIKSIIGKFYVEQSNLILEGI